MKLLIEMTPEEQASYWKRQAEHLRVELMEENSSANAYMYQLIDQHAELKALQAKYDTLASQKVDLTQAPEEYAHMIRSMEAENGDLKVRLAESRKLIEKLQK